MRSAFICVLIALTIHKEGSHAADDFRPTPIPLSEWHDDSRHLRAGTLHETFRTESPPSVAIIPAHYWEDALRHSVYLTLVRDKIDQLIAKGEVISPNTKPDQEVSKEIDDHDLWEKIKSAPFERRPEEELASFGDVTILARGRLLEEMNGFRFTEDERSKEKCTGDKCMDGVKAIWSVKRVRQRDQETSPGRYHYELTFSVISQTPKKQKKPYENPIRTFTVRESTPDRITDAPQELTKFEKKQPQSARPERALWIHRNITPTKYHLGRSYYHGLDRIFSSLFSDDDDETPQEASPRYKPNSYVPQVYNPQYSKTGYVGAPTEQHQQNVKYMPYPYKQPVKYSRPLPPPPHQLPHSPHHYLEGDSAEIPNGNPYTHSNSYPIPSDYKGVPSSKPVKTTRPAVLPTPLPPITPTKDLSFEVSNIMRFGNDTTHLPETITVYKNYNKFRAPPGKVNYFPEHIRPPVYNAPPGVFVTMDKKPFKPMPPLKMMPSAKPTRHNRPIDFRPSPQIQDNQSAEPDSFSETAFRPITTSYLDGNMNYTENSKIIENYRKGQNKIRKLHSSAKKPSRKQENTKSERVTTNAPEIITAGSTSEEDIDSMEWANILGAFTKTTPMASPTEKVSIIETTTPLVTTQSLPTTKRRVTTTTTTETVTEASTTTTPRPKKRTRPPPKFSISKQEKIKKHKRVTTSTTTTTTNAPDMAVITRPTKDLMPQASSAALSSTRSLLETTSLKESSTSFSTPASTTTTTTTSTTSTSRPTTTKTSTTTTKPTTTKPTTTTNESSESKTSANTAPTRPKSKNRFRQSTLMQKGTSVNHDKWSINGGLKNQTISSSGVNYPYRRKGSNFQGYVSSSKPINTLEEKRERNHADRAPGSFATTTTVTIIKPKTTTPSTTTEQVIDEDDSNSESTADHIQEEEYEESEEEKSAENDEDEIKDHTEYIFQSTTQQPNNQNNEVIGLEESVTTDQIVTSPHSAPKNKTKCKKKKQNNLSNSEKIDVVHNVSPTTTTTTTTTTEKAITDIFQDLFNGFNFGGTSEKDNEISATKPDAVEEESENHEEYLKIDDDFKDFLDNLGEKKNLESNNDDEEHYDDDDDEKVPSIDDEDSEFVNEDEKNSGRNSNDDSNNYEDYQDRPYSFLELLAME